MFLLIAEVTVLSGDVGHFLFCCGGRQVSLWPKRQALWYFTVRFDQFLVLMIVWGSSLGWMGFCSRKFLTFWCQQACDRSMDHAAPATTGACGQDSIPEFDLSPRALPAQEAVPPPAAGGGSGHAASVQEVFK